MKITRNLKNKMNAVDVGIYSAPVLSFRVVISAIFWFFVPRVTPYHVYYYDHYLRSYIWKYRRKKRLIKDNFACVTCGNSNAILDVHHLSYDRVCRESSEDLRTLCRHHHRKLHNK